MVLLDYSLDVGINFNSATIVASPSTNGSHGFHPHSSWRIYKQSFYNLWIHSQTCHHIQYIQIIDEEGRGSISCWYKTLRSNYWCRSIFHWCRLHAPIYNNFPNNNVFFLTPTNLLIMIGIPICSTTQNNHRPKNFIKVKDLITTQIPW